MSFSSHNPLITFMADGVPRINDIKLDSKLELDSDLAKTCEAFIIHVTKITVDPMLSFITKVTAVRVAMSAAGSEKAMTPAKKIRDQAFATSTRVTSIIEKVASSISELLPPLLEKMRLYIKSEKSLQLLFQPIKANIVEAYGQMITIIENEYDDSERAGFGHLSLDGLKGQLDMYMMRE